LTKTKERWYDVTERVRKRYMTESIMTESYFCDVLMHTNPSLSFMTFPPPLFLHVRGTPNLFIFVLFADAETVCPTFITSCYGIAIRWTTQFLAPTLCLDILRRDQWTVLNTWIFLTHCFKIQVSIFSAECIYSYEMWGSQGGKHDKYCLPDWTASQPRKQSASLSHNIFEQA
jgi:hypothetical protein